jgi:transcriptional regulator with XRE-family HTH domain
MAVLIQAGMTMGLKDEQFAKDMGTRIAKARKAQHLTQQQLADDLGLAQQTIAHYEAGRLRVPASMLSAMSRKLGLTVDELLGDDTGSHGKRGPAPKFVKQIERMNKLPRAKQQLLMEMLDAFLSRADH